MKKRSVKVIFDTNVWISFLIGKRLTKIKEIISSGYIIVVISPQLIEEIRLVTERPKLKKYFPKNSVIELLILLETIAESYETQPIYSISRDQKDNFLFDLIDASEAHFLITGDKDLLEHNPFKTAQILTPKEFESDIIKLFEKS
jgi:putative PIN family toxin of toxin-antitoxin system